MKGYVSETIWTRKEATIAGAACRLMAQRRAGKEIK